MFRRRSSIVSLVLLLVTAPVLLAGSPTEPLLVAADLPEIGSPDLPQRLPWLRISMLKPGDELFVVGDDPAGLTDPPLEWRPAQSMESDQRWVAAAGNLDWVVVAHESLAAAAERSVTIGVDRRLDDGSILQISRALTRSEGRLQLSAPSLAHIRNMLRFTLPGSATVAVAENAVDEEGRVHLSVADPRVLEISGLALKVEPYIEATVQSLATAALSDSVTGETGYNVDYTTHGCPNYYGSQITISSAPAAALITSFDISYRVYHSVDVSHVWAMLWRKGTTYDPNPLSVYQGTVTGSTWLDRSNNGMTGFNGKSVNYGYLLGCCNAVSTSESGYLDWWRITVYYQTQSNDIDLVADSISLSSATVTAGSTVSASYFGHVSGNGTVGSSFSVGFYLSSDANITTGDTLLDRVTITSASSPGDSFGQSSPGRSLTIPGGTAAGAYYLGMIVDDLGAVTETTETNNAASATLSVTSPTPTTPNLTVSSCSVSPTSAAAGGTVNLTWRGQNTGNAASGPFNYGIYLSNDAVLSTGADTQLLNLSVPGGWGASYDNGNVVSPVTLPSSLSAGTYYVGAFLDTANTVSESNNNDNQCVAALAVTAASNSACQSNDQTLCLNNGRFRVRATWRTAQGQTGNGHAVQLTDDSGYFWFFDSANIELVTKVLNGCPFTSHYWVFAAGLTNVEVTLTVWDTSTEVSKSYVNPLNTAFQPIQDTAAFATCP